ncbi:hypothetical protein EN751_00190 [Mesorhizobium sp. M4A.F.Ca.ET.029.04.2.1]|nr:hypothetical protein EN779_01205 [Mesorhizobium sp. M4B.F.Ca.ET.088.02.2.1]RVD74294.1 hypothetical protein EN751_00190 [Mesorhizobium sp. M4A.F.Ca.ET.029.04.2.1]RWF28753.1 MAG: hypothetical protein EOS45_21180 [Mesorhizobium sp.]RWL02820.1 MAG: hypothetical protein EOR55_20735 [Mesorhizobium sp.]
MESLNSVSSVPKRCAMAIAKPRGMKRAKVALARKLTTLLHRMGGNPQKPRSVIFKTDSKGPKTFPIRQGAETV